LISPIRTWRQPHRWRAAPCARSSPARSQPRRTTTSQTTAWAELSPGNQRQTRPGCSISRRSSAASAAHSPVNSGRPGDVQPAVEPIAHLREQHPPGPPILTATRGGAATAERCIGR
jgi:hypothetical protein